MWKAILGLLTFRLSFAATPKKIAAFLEGKGETDRRNAEFAARRRCAGRPCTCARAYRDWKDYASEIYRLAKSAVDTGAQVVVYPEYVGLAPLTTVPGWKRMLRWLFGGTLPALDGPFPQPVDGRLEQVAAALHGYLYELYMYTFSTVARLQHVYLVAGSALFWEEGRLINRCVVFGPDGSPRGAQEKICAIGPDRALGVEPSGSSSRSRPPSARSASCSGRTPITSSASKSCGSRARGSSPSPAWAAASCPTCCAAAPMKTASTRSTPATPPGGAARCGIFAPLDATPGRNGVVALADGPAGVRACGAHQPGKAAPRGHRGGAERPLPRGGLPAQLPLLRQAAAARLKQKKPPPAPREAVFTPRRRRARSKKKTSLAAR